MLVTVYSLTPEEVALISALNEDRDRVRLKVDATEEGFSVDAIKLQDSRFDSYMLAVNEVDAGKLVEVAAKGAVEAKTLYKVSQEEASVIEAINHKRSNTLLIVCCYGDFIGVVPEDLQRKEFAMYLDLLGGFDPKKVVEVDVKSPFE